MANNPMGFFQDRPAPEVEAEPEEPTQFYDQHKVKITKGDTFSSNPWVEGHLVDDPNVTFSAKVFDVGSDHGIKNGRISQLKVWDGEPDPDNEMLSYDRRWEDIPMSLKGISALSAITDAFPTADAMTQEQRERWETEKDLQGFFEMERGKERDRDV